MTLKQVMSAGTELGGPKPYEENLNLMSCKMSSVRPIQAVAQIEITVLPRWDVESVCEIKFPGMETNDVCQQALKQYEVTDVHSRSNVLFHLPGKRGAVDVELRFGGPLMISGKRKQNVAGWEVKLPVRGSMNTTFEF